MCLPPYERLADGVVLLLGASWFFLVMYLISKFMAVAGARRGGGLVKKVSWCSCVEIALAVWVVFC